MEFFLRSKNIRKWNKWFTHKNSLLKFNFFLDVYYECVGENWPLLSRGEEHVIRYLEQIDGILSIVNEKNEPVWYVRGKTFNGEKRGQIYRPNNQPKSDFDLSTNPHGNAPNTCIQYNNNNNNNNFRNARHTASNMNNNNNNKRNNNGYNGDINRNYDPRNGKQLVFEKNFQFSITHSILFFFHLIFILFQLFWNWPINCCSIPIFGDVS